MKTGTQEFSGWQFLGYVPANQRTPFWHCLRPATSLSDRQSPTILDLFQAALYQTVLKAVKPSPTESNQNILNSAVVYK